MPPPLIYDTSLPYISTSFVVCDARSMMFEISESHTEYCTNILEVMDLYHNIK
jgi:hypothetical protein